MIPSDASDRKAYLPPATMEQSQLALPSLDPQAGLRSMPPHLPPYSHQRTDPYPLGLFQSQPHQPHASMPPGNPRKRRTSQTEPLHSLPPVAGPASGIFMDGRYASMASHSDYASPGQPPKKKTRTNTPWSAAEEQRLKQMRDMGSSWSEIAKTFPTRTEGSVKKHWYKDMHYAEFGKDESDALQAAIKEYEANKWKVIGAKVGKPAKACEQYAKDHFGYKP